MADGLQLVIDDADVRAGLNRIAEAGGDIRPAQEDIGAYLVTSTQRRFERETAPDGAKWKRLSPRTAEKRIKGRRRGYDNILRVSRRLEQSIFEEVDAEGVRVGSNVVYAAIHQEGGTIEMPARTQTIYQNYDARRDHFDPRFRSPRRSNFARDVNVKAHSVTIPARPYLGLDDADRAEILEIIEEHFRQTGAVQ